MKEHEQALTEFAGSLFENEAFQSSFQPLFEKVAWFGAINSLSQVLLKATAPGVPDFYRGTDRLGTSYLVDPDNRRPVEFAPSTDLEEPAGNLFKDWRNGRVKIYLTEKTLLYRRQHPDIFTSGEYIPVTVRGKRAENVFAFLRRSESDWVLVVVPRFPARISSAVRPPLGMRVWHDTELVLPGRKRPRAGTTESLARMYACGIEFFQWAERWRIPCRRCSPGAAHYTWINEPGKHSDAAVCALRRCRSHGQKFRLRCSLFSAAPS